MEAAWWGVAKQPRPNWPSPLRVGCEPYTVLISQKCRFAGITGYYTGLTVYFLLVRSNANPHRGPPLGSWRTPSSHIKLLGHFTVHNTAGCLLSDTMPMPGNAAWQETTPRSEDGCQRTAPLPHLGGGMDTVHCTYSTWIPCPEADGRYRSACRPTAVSDHVDSHTFDWNADAS